MMKRLAFSLVLAALAAPGSAHAQAIYVVSQPTPALAPTYSGWSSVSLLDNTGSPDTDTGIATLTLPFPFSYYGKAYTTVDVTMDGIFVFEPGSPKKCTGGLVGDCYNTKNFPDPAVPNGLLAPWMADMESSSAKVDVTTVGTAPNRIYSVKWSNWEHYSSGGVRTMQVDFEEGTNAIVMYYGAISVTTGTGKAGAGMEDANGATGLTFLPCTNTTARCLNADWPAGKMISVAPAVDPDLMLTGVIGSTLTSTTVNGNPGYSLDVTVRVKNQGQNPAAGFAFDLYLCKQASVVLNDPTKCTLLRSHTAPETLAGQKEGSYLETGLEFEKPAAGTFYLGVNLDPTNEVKEALESNNTGVSMGYLIGVDLEGLVSGPGNAGPGDDANLQVTIRNRGTDPSGVPFSYQLWLTTGTTIVPASDKLFYTGTVPAIGGGETLELTPPAKLPFTLADGKYYYILVVDPVVTGKPTGDVLELTETNNTAVASGTVTISAADILVKEVKIKSAAAPYPETTTGYFGEKVRVSFTAMNAGGGTAKNFYICVLLSDTPMVSLFDIDMTPNEPLLLNQTYVGKETKTIEVEATIPTQNAAGKALTDGTYYIGVIIDCRNTVPESNKTNNKAVATKGIGTRQPAMDLTPVQVQAPAVAAVGEVLPVYRVMRNLGNRGNEAPDAAPFLYRYYLSSNEIISSEDLPLVLVDAEGKEKSAGEGHLAPGGVDRATDLVLIPQGISPGTYFVGLVLDPANAIPELDKTNNALGSLGTVEVVASSLRVETSSLPDALVGVDYLQQLVASGGDGTYVWTVEAGQGDLPKGVTLSAAGELKGQPTDAAVSVFTVKVASGGRSALARLAMRAVVPSSPLAILSAKLPTAVKGLDYSVKLSAVGGVRPYVWLLEEGSIPDGLTLEQDGRLSGKLTRSYGNVTFKVSVQDAFGSRVVGEMSLRAVEPGTLFVATVKLGDAQVGIAYQQLLQSLGGTAPYTWSIAPESIPEGLRLQGNSLLGTPTRAGYYPVIAEVTDAAGFTDTGAFILSVRSRPATFTMPAVPEATMGADYALNLSLGARPRTKFEIYGGELPPGLTMNAEGRITGKIPDPADPRSYDSVLLIIEEAGAQALVPLTIRIAPKPIPAAVPTETTGCSAAGAGLFPLLGLALLPLLVRRRKALGLAAVLAAVLGAAPAQAAYQLSPVISAPFSPLVGGSAISMDLTDQTNGPQQVVALPFAFRFFGESHTSLHVGCRGFLGFGPTAVGNLKKSAGIPSSAPGGAFPIVAPWWGEWDCLPGQVSYAVSGVTPLRVVTFQWDRVWYAADTAGKAANGVTFQARLHETTGKIEFAYGPSTMSAYQPPEAAKAPKAAVGIQGPGGVAGLAGLPCGTTAVCGVADYQANTQINFTQAADLTLTRVYSDDVGYAGVPLRVGATVFNQGGEDVKNITVRFFLSTDAALDPAKDLVLGTSRAIDVAVQQRRDVLLTPILPSNLTNSPFYLFALADPDNQAAEDNEANNAGPAGGRKVTLGGPTPDLVVGSVTADKATLAAGGALAVTHVIKNVGSGRSGPCGAPADCGTGWTCDVGRCRKSCTAPTDCPAGQSCGTAGTCETAACTTDDTCPAGEGCVTGTCTIRKIAYSVYLSENPVVTRSDRLLTAAPGTVELAEGIPAFGEKSTVENLVVPADLLPGEYYVGVIVDPDQKLPEILMVNNTGVMEAPFKVVSDSLAIVTKTLPAAQVQSAYSVRVHASGGDGHYVFTLANGTKLPAGLALSASGDIAGLPAAPVAGASFDVQVASAGKVATAKLTLDVTASAVPLTVVTQDLPAAEYSKPYVAKLTAVGGKPPYAWSLAAGAVLPYGLALGQDGTLEGSPGRDGTFPFGVEVKDAAGKTAAQPLTLTVVAPDRLRIATQFLPEGTVGKSYLGTLQAVGGKPTYSWSVVEVQAVPSLPTDIAPLPTTRLPEPLQLVNTSSSTRIQGVPVQAGTYIVTLKVVDLTGAEDNASFVLTMRHERGLEIATLALPDAIAGKAYLAELAATGGADTGAVTWSVTCTPRYNEKNELLPCKQQLPPGIALTAEGVLSTASVEGCNLPVDAPKGCPENLTCTEEGRCVLTGPLADDSGHRPERTIYTFLVRASEAKTNRTAVRALSITVRVDEPVPVPAKETEGCSTVGGQAGLLPALFAALGLLRRRRSDSRRGRGTRVALFACLLALAGFALSCGDNTVALKLGKCEVLDEYNERVPRTCPETLTCDPGDGVCKCGGEGGTICGEGGVCRGDVCVYACTGVTCDRGMALDRLDCKCKCGQKACAANETCDALTRTCFVPTLCKGVTCGGGMSCDPVDGVCKCGTAACSDGQVCQAGACVADKCAGVHCSGGTVCDPADGACKCGGAAGRACSWGEACGCPTGTSCKDEDRRCAASTACNGKVCAGGTTCDPSDGTCRCGGPGGPVCQYGQTCDVLRKTCVGGNRCVSVACDRGLTCDPEDGVCKCGGINGVNGQVCATGDACAHFTSAPRCVKPCDPRTQGCASGEGCYFDIFALVSYCAPAGIKTDGMGCRAATECARGYHCQQQPNQTGKCRRYCSVPDGTSGCPQMNDAQDCFVLDGADTNVGACDVTG